MLNLFQDGMDQAKFRVPRTRDRSSKLLSKMFRPQLHVALTWIHGFRLMFNVSDEDLKKDSETQAEQIALGLSRVVDEHGQLPRGINIQQDNTAREGKNQFISAFGLLLTALDVFRYVCLSFLRVGHSSSDVKVSVLPSRADIIEIKRLGRDCAPVPSFSFGDHSKVTRTEIKFSVSRLRSSRGKPLTLRMRS